MCGENMVALMNGACGKMMTGGWFLWLLTALLLLGLIALVFLWIWKLWKELSKKRK